MGNASSNYTTNNIKVYGSNNAVGPTSFGLDTRMTASAELSVPLSPFCTDIVPYSAVRDLVPYNSGNSSNMLVSLAPTALELIKKNVGAGLVKVLADNGKTYLTTLGTKLGNKLMSAFKNIVTPGGKSNSNSYLPVDKISDVTEGLSEIRQQMSSSQAELENAMTIIAPEVMVSSMPTPDVAKRLLEGNGLNSSTVTSGAISYFLSEVGNDAANLSRDPYGIIGSNLTHLNALSMSNFSDENITGKIVKILPRHMMGNLEADSAASVHARTHALFSRYTAALSPDMYFKVSMATLVSAQISDAIGYLSSMTNDFISKVERAYFSTEWGSGKTEEDYTAALNYFQPYAGTSNPVVSDGAGHFYSENGPLGNPQQMRNNPGTAGCYTWRKMGCLDYTLKSGNTEVWHPKAYKKTFPASNPAVDPNYMLPAYFMPNVSEVGMDPVLEMQITWRVSPSDHDKWDDFTARLATNPGAMGIVVFGMNNGELIQRRIPLNHVSVTTCTFPGFAYWPPANPRGAGGTTNMFEFTFGVSFRMDETVFDSSWSASKIWPQAVNGKVMSAHDASPRVYVAIDFTDDTIAADIVDMEQYIFVTMNKPQYIPRPAMLTTSKIKLNDTISYTNTDSISAYVIDAISVEREAYYDFIDTVSTPSEEDWLKYYSACMARMLNTQSTISRYMSVASFVYILRLRLINPLTLVLQSYLDQNYTERMVLMDMIAELMKVDLKYGKEFKKLPKFQMRQLAQGLFSYCIDPVNVMTFFVGHKIERLGTWTMATKQAIFQILLMKTTYAYGGDSTAVNNQILRLIRTGQYSELIQSLHFPLYVEPDTPTPSFVNNVAVTGGSSPGTDPQAINVTVDLGNKIAGLVAVADDV